MAWSDSQAKSFAKRIAERYKPAWFVLTNDIREAVVSEHVMLVVLAQDAVTVEVEAITQLRRAVCRHLFVQHKMGTETGELEVKS
jgi:hypothetical protein